MNKLSSEGYNVSMKKVSRSTMTSGEKAVMVALGTVGMMAGGMGVIVTKQTDGTKYKVRKPKQQ